MTEIRSCDPVEDCLSVSTFVTVHAGAAGKTWYKVTTKVNGDRFGVGFNPADGETDKEMRERAALAIARACHRRWGPGALEASTLLTGELVWRKME